MNKVLLGGRLTLDPELRSLASGSSVATSHARSTAAHSRLVRLRILSDTGRPRKSGHTRVAVGPTLGGRGSTMGSEAATA